MARNLKPYKVDGVFVEGARRMMAENDTWSEELRPQIEKIMGEGWIVCFDENHRTGDIELIRIYAESSSTDIMFDDLSALSSLLRTKKINIAHESGFGGSEFTPAEPNTTTIYVSKGSCG